MLEGIKKLHISARLCAHLVVGNHKPRCHALILCWLITAGAPVSAAQDDYLKALESEARSTGSLTKKQNRAANTAKPSGASSKLKTDFEQLLEFELPSTFKFYSKLNSTDQIKVVQLYTQEKKMSAASKLIFDLYFDSHKSK